MNYLAAEASGKQRPRDPFVISIERDPLLTASATPASGIFTDYDLAYTAEACNAIDYGGPASAACKADLDCVATGGGDCSAIICTEDQMDAACFHRALLKHRTLSMRLMQLQNNQHGALSRQTDFDGFYNAELIKSANLGVGVLGLLVGIGLILRGGSAATVPMPP